MLTLLSGIQAAVTGAKIGMKIGEKICEHLIKEKKKVLVCEDEEYIKKTEAALNICIICNALANMKNTNQKQ